MHFRWPLFVAAAVVGATLTACAPGSEPSRPASLPSIQTDLDRLVAAGATAARATLYADGSTYELTAGIADRSSGAAVPENAQVRIGSVAKSFVASIVLQLVAEKQIRPDAPIATYLPGRIAGAGIDENAITVRLLLEHRTGLPEFAGEPGADESAAARENTTLTPSAALAIALRKPAVFPAGARFEYSNTNYLVLAMLIEQVTGNSYGEELQHRILDPVQLPDTYLPPTGEHDIRGPHPRGYTEVDGEIVDASRIEPSVPWASGALVSTGTDLNRFFTALLAGTVVPEPQLKEMRETNAGDIVPGTSYGLGLTATRLRCGETFYGHVGGIAGYTTIAGATSTGDALTIALTHPEVPFDIRHLLDTAFCP